MMSIRFLSKIVSISKQSDKKITSITCPLCSGDGLREVEEEGYSLLCTNVFMRGGMGKTSYK